jgi:hypothetical protein
MPIKKKKVKAPTKPKSKPKAKAKPRVNAKATLIAKAYEAGLKAGMPSYGSIPRTGGNYAVAQGLPPQVLVTAASTPLGSNINERLYGAYNALVWARNPPSKEEFDKLPSDVQKSYIEAIGNILGREAQVQFKENMGKPQNPSDINPLFQAPSQKGGFDMPSARSFSNLMSEVVNTEIYDDPTTNTYFTGSSFINRPSRFPQQTSDIFDLNQIEKLDNALSNLARQTKASQEDIQVSQTLETQAYPELSVTQKKTKNPTGKPRGRPKKKGLSLIIEEEQ